jgi:hypothetical protein
MAKRLSAAFPRTVTTEEKINITSLTLALAQVSRNPAFAALGVKMIDSLYSKSRARVLARTDTLVTVLNSYEKQGRK